MTKAFLTILLLAAALLHAQTPSLTLQAMVNPDFELGKPGEVPQGWGWFHRGRQGGIAVSEEAKEGRQSLHVVAPAGKDWAVTNAKRLPVKTGEHYLFRCWVKASKVENAKMQIVGYKNGKHVTWNAAASHNFPVSPNAWKPVKGFFEVDDGIDTINLRLVGNGETDFLVDCITLEAFTPKVMEQKPLVKGHATKRIMEPFGRGVVAQETDDGVYVTWRLLKEDAPDAAFDLFRKVNGQETKLNDATIRQTCDFLDKSPVDGATYIVRELNGGKPGEATVWKRDANSDHAYKSYKLSNPKAKIQKVGIGDLDGDGTYDFVVKHPATNIDPWNVVWYKSPDTYKLEAFLGNGTRLWTVDLGWDIEQGIWYSPYCI
ncbi:MAG: carbohydrate binding domain-containing protein, partial [Victivallales bacterium]|nr:carbohydrate binding domain-containing protein [Victivallales bacterium]